MSQISKLTKPRPMSKLRSPRCWRNSKRRRLSGNWKFARLNLPMMWIHTKRWFSLDKLNADFELIYTISKLMVLKLIFCWNKLKVVNYIFSFLCQHWISLDHIDSLCSDQRIEIFRSWPMRDWICNFHHLCGFLCFSNAFPCATLLRLLDY